MHDREISEAQRLMDGPLMARALELARRAGAAGEVPVGAVLARNAEILGEGWNAQIAGHDPSAHAEIQALRWAGQRLGNYRLPGTTLYVSLEPCSMCCGALIHARVSRLVFAALEPRAGAVISARQLLDERDFNHRVHWSQDLRYADASGDMLRGFFRERRD